MEPKKEYNPLEEIAVTLTMEEWDSLLHWLQNGIDHYQNKLYMAAHIKNDTAAAALHYKLVAQYEQIYKTIDETICPPKPKAE